MAIVAAELDLVFASAAAVLNFLVVVAVIHCFHCPRFPCQLDDAGKYTLRAENCNGCDSVDLDLIVLDPLQDCSCDMLKSLNMECACSLSFRQSELSAQQILVVDHGVEMEARKL